MSSSLFLIAIKYKDNKFQQLILNNAYNYPILSYKDKIICEIKLLLDRNNLAQKIFFRVFLLYYIIFIEFIIRHITQTKITWKAVVSNTPSTKKQ